MYPDLLIEIFYFLELNEIEKSLNVSKLWNLTIKAARNAQYLAQRRRIYELNIVYAIPHTVICKNVSFPKILVKI